MPKSKRDNKVTLSKTKKKGRERKEKIVNAIREAAENYSSAYVFTLENMRNLKFKELKNQLKSSSRARIKNRNFSKPRKGIQLFKQKTISRFFLGPNKVIQVSLGRSASDEIKQGLHKASKLVRGGSGVFFTNLPKEEVIRLFKEYEEYDFARTGSIATETVELKEGPLEQFTHEMEPFLRKQAMPVRLNKGVVELVSDYVVCEEGKQISPEASRILRLLGTKLATFRLHLVCRWSEDDFEVYKEGLEGSDIESS